MEGGLKSAAPKDIVEAVSSKVNGANVPSAEPSMGEEAPIHEDIIATMECFIMDIETPSLMVGGDIPKDDSVNVEPIVI